MSQSQKNEVTLFCFDKCISSFKDKVMNPYEKECIFPCLQHQYMLFIEANNQFIKQTILENELLSEDSLKTSF